MSANENTVEEQQQQQTQQQHLSQIWPQFNFINHSVNVANIPQQHQQQQYGNNMQNGTNLIKTATAATTNAGDGDGSGSGGSLNSHHNNNYVNFNQFIMQHNFGAGGGGGGATPASSLMTPSSSTANVSNINNGGVTTIGGNGVAGFGNYDSIFGWPNPPTTALPNVAYSSIKTAANSTESYLAPNVFYGSSSITNPFYYNNDISTHSNSLYTTTNNIGIVAMPNGSSGQVDSVGPTNTAAAATTIPTATEANNLNVFENLYTPFGALNINGSGGGPSNYFINPFAIDSGQFINNASSTTTATNSNLQISAPEFVPREVKITNGNAEISNTLENDGSKNSASLMKSEETEIKNNATINGRPTTATELQSRGPTTIEYATNQNRRNNGYRGGGGGTSSSNNKKGNKSYGGLSKSEKIEKSNASARADRVREHDNRRYQSTNGGGRDSIFLNDAATSSFGRNDVEPRRERQQQQQHHQQRFDKNDKNERSERGSDRYDRSERLERGERMLERGERSERHGERRGNRDRDRDRDRFDNNRSNKRRDDWNRNRNLRVEEKYSSDNGKDSPLTSPEKKTSPKKIYPENEKLSQREKLIRDIELRRLECLVCVEPIKSHQAVWSCQNCYHILHLNCITKWAASSKSDEGWRCPACQNVCKDVPRDYFCFCGKLKNPPYTRDEIAHSCGNVCGRNEGCPHACTLLCHPGPCPPCQANVKRDCGCGRTTKITQCCLKEDFECESICEKLLNCELHQCKAKCHGGKCEPCAEKVDQTCHCGKHDRQVACTKETHDKHNYSCSKPCGKDLLCGNHKCKDCCHAGDCRPCKLSPEMVTSCPCGKMAVIPESRTSCLDPIPLCEGVCSKTLRCGKAAHPHRCTSKCHLGNCPPCNKQTAVKCRCGHMDQMIKCRQLSTRGDDARCKKRCTKKRSCGKHKCNQECCIDIDHICPLPCNYTLSCGKHKCDQTCHRGNCPPCYRSSFEELYCECGAEVIYPPVPCGTKRPVCKRPCSRSHPCEHPPQHNCHSATTCPPCILFTTKWCFGQHEQRKTIPCSQESFSCGMACQKPLPCGRHKCIKTCHEGACQTTGEVCKQNCTTLRLTCGHKCMAPCHDGNCPDTLCKEMVEVQCECGHRKQMRVCHDLAREYSRIATAQLASSMAEMQRGNYMELSEILTPVKVHKTNKTLDCNEECRTLERNRRLAVGFGQTGARNTELPKILTKYSEFIRGFAKRDPTLVKTIFDALTNLVKLAKESKQKSRSHSFPVMNREKRQLVHELCEMFGVESVAYDAEPNRNVVATAFKDRCWYPATSIMEVVQRETGQRRVPVPSNVNAWGIKK